MCEELTGLEMSRPASPPRRLASNEGPLLRRARRANDLSRIVSWSGGLGPRCRRRRRSVGRSYHGKPRFAGDSGTIMGGYRASGLAEGRATAIPKTAIFTPEYSREPPLL
jgi:hypothetical protein